jgi:hypothetical protein
MLEIPSSSTVTAEGSACMNACPAQTQMAKPKPRTTAFSIFSVEADHLRFESRRRSIIRNVPRKANCLHD